MAWVFDKYNIFNEIIWNWSEKVHLWLKSEQEKIGLILTRKYSLLHATWNLPRE